MVFGVRVFQQRAVIAVIQSPNARLYEIGEWCMRGTRMEKDPRRESGGVIAEDRGVRDAYSASRRQRPEVVHGGAVRPARGSGQCGMWRIIGAWMDRCEQQLDRA
jgi:hypothetical protein